MSQSTEAPKPPDKTSSTRHSRKRRRRAPARSQPQVTPSPDQTRPLFSDVSTVADKHPELLGEWARENAAFLKAQGWEKLARDRRGRSAIDENVRDLPHPSAAYLDYLRRQGAPVLSSDPPPSPEDLQAAADRGPHPSANVHAEFLFEEAYEMCKRRHTMVLPLSVVKKLRGVRISPPGVVPQPERRP
ncbi:hypothetical protein THAOC_17565 [Thalassiosira oceanica]|uniref:Uncharacterized protein n=1 Tax=Thalassiosira oceanica TaxID=159749 RepID=K0SUC5_THAOC|nr:hypothetical protein THAOC_17565 [Thalassiosira oceanica]|eukprot:EJK61867.1 hypothetical protein THAOC_17565 [Thalassiosira oceanica]